MERNHSRILQDDPLLGKIVERLVEAYQPLRIYLFGSTARNEALPDSDYDLLVIVPDRVPSFRQKSRPAYQVLWDIGRSGDIIVLSRSSFDSRIHLAASLPSIVMREGKLLYGS